MMLGRETLIATSRRILKADPGKRLLVDVMWVANTHTAGLAWTMYLLRAALGETGGVTNTLVPGSTIAANEFIVIESASTRPVITLEPTEELYAFAGTTNLVTVTMFGREEKA